MNWKLKTILQTINNNTMAHMKHVYMFQWNIPADNQYSGQKDRYINVIAEWNGGFYDDGRPMVYVDGINFTFHDAFQVKDWSIAKDQIRKIAENHFAEIAKAVKIAKARAELIAAGEETGNPVLDRYTQAMHDLIAQENLS